MICGYVLGTKFLLDYGVKHGISRPDVEEDDSEDGFEVAAHILISAGLFLRAQIRGTYVLEDGERVSKCCLALANNYSTKAMKELPPEKWIKKLQEVLGTDERPQWYPRV